MPSKALTDYSSCGCVTANEPLIACDEGVIGCGESSSTEVLPPTLLRIEQLESANGVFGLKVVDEICLNVEGSPCLPGLRPIRHTQRFKDWYAESRKLGCVESSRMIYMLLKDRMVAEDQEVFFAVLLDTKLYVRGWGEIARGARDSVNVPIPDVLRLPIMRGAQTIVIAHNHPSGSIEPSDADKHLTKEIGKALKSANLYLMDHLVIGADGYFSFADEGLL